MYGEVQQRRLRRTGLRRWWPSKQLSERVTHALVGVEVQRQLGVVALNNDTRRALDSLRAHAALQSSEKHTAQTMKVETLGPTKLSIRQVELADDELWNSRESSEQPQLLLVARSLLKTRDASGLQLMIIKRDVAACIVNAAKRSFKMLQRTDSRHRPQQQHDAAAEGSTCAQASTAATRKCICYTPW